MRCITPNTGEYIRDTNAAVGIGTMIIFIAMILIAGIAASVMLQTMDGLQSQAMKTGSESIDEISSGVEVTHISGFQLNGKIDRLAVMVSPLAGSADVDLSTLIVQITNNEKQVYCTYNQSVFSLSIGSGLFQTVNTNELNPDEFGIIVIRDTDGSCTATTPVITQNDLVVLMMNTTKSFSGLSPRSDVSGKVTPESGISGTIRFATPSNFVDPIIELQP